MLSGQYFGEKSRSSYNDEVYIFLSTVILPYNWLLSDTWSNLRSACQCSGSHPLARRLLGNWRRQVRPTPKTRRSCTHSSQHSGETRGPPYRREGFIPCNTLKIPYNARASATRRRIRGAPLQCNGNQSLTSRLLGSRIRQIIGPTQGRANLHDEACRKRHSIFQRRLARILGMAG